MGSEFQEGYFVMSRSRRETKGWQKIPAGYKRAAKRFAARRVRRTINDAPTLSAT